VGFLLARNLSVPIELSFGKGVINRNKELFLMIRFWE
jgi:hypothetical protein